MRYERVALVGRDVELAALRSLLDDHPVVTVTGVGGVGKTRLALAVAEDADRSGTSATVCELAGVSAPSQVSSAVGEALGFPSLEAALVGLAERRWLLMIDNCEHVLDAAAAAVERLIEECPGLSILATSREPLGLPAEHVLALETLALPATEDQADAERSPAVGLFLSRAAAAGADLRLDPSTTPTIVRLCRRLDGLPLAIELAAARTRSLTPAEILVHVDRRLDLLERRRWRGPTRHRSLEAAIGWSYERLPEVTRMFFDRLGAFAGPFSAEAAQSVAGAPGEDLLRVVGHLDQLVAQSLVGVRAQAGRSWYGLLETLRAFARSRLEERGELELVQDRWVDSLVAVAGDAVQRGLRSGSLDSWLTVHTVQGDLQDALRWCLDHDRTPDRAIRLFTPLWWIVYNARAEAAAELGDRLLGRWPDPARPGWAAVAAITGFAHVVLGQPERGAALAEQALAAPHSALAAVVARRALYVRAHAAGLDEQALGWVEEALAEAGGLPAWHNELQTSRALVLARLGRTEEAIAQAGAARAAAAALGSPMLEAWAALAYGCLVALEDPAAGQVTLQPLALRCQEIGYPLGTGRCLRALGAIALVRDDLADAAAALGQALDVFVQIGHVAQLQATLRWVAALANANGHAAEAAALQHAAGSARSPISDVLEHAYRDRLIGEPRTAAPLPLRDAIALARRELGAIGAPPPAASAAAAPAAPVTLAAPSSAAQPNRLRLEGAVWTLAFDATTVRLSDAKGLHDLAVLIGRAGREVHCTELMGAAVDQPDTGPALDAEARRRYETRIVELQDELVEAEDANDRGRADKARLEMDLLVDQLTAASGLGGRARRGGGTTERARSAVSWRIRAAIKRIVEVHPALGRHLDRAVRTGTWCAYEPGEPVAWELDAPGL